MQQPLHPMNGFHFFASKNNSICTFSAKIQKNSSIGRCLRLHFTAEYGKVILRHELNKLYPRENTFLVKVLSRLIIPLGDYYSICVAAKEIAFFVRLACGAHFFVLTENGVSSGDDVL